MHELRDYEPERDREAVHRLWKEVGWFKEDDEETMDSFLSLSRARVAELKGSAECLVLTVPGVLRYLDTDIDLSVVTSVATSRVARKQGLAGKLTAKAVAEDAEEGAELAALGIFEQGFYDRLGFGTGSYEQWVYFDPSDLVLDVEAGAPERITSEDWEKAHESRIKRKRCHGACSILKPEGTKTEMEHEKNDFGLGFFDDSGELTHHIWFGVDSIEQGPYYVKWMAYRDYDQFLELMAVMRNLGDQVKLIRMNEPPEIQIQSLLKKPLHKRRITRKSKYENKIASIAYWQMRILDLESCISKTHLKGGSVSFNLHLRDPIEDMLPDDCEWRGVSGRYTVRLGGKSSVEEGFTEGLPKMKAGVGAFTRMWLGVRTPTGISVTDDLEAPKELLNELDDLLSLPDPHTDWGF